LSKYWNFFQILFLTLLTSIGGEIVEENLSNETSKNSTKLVDKSNKNSVVEKSTKNSTKIVDKSAKNSTKISTNSTGDGVTPFDDYYYDDLEVKVSF